MEKNKFPANFYQTYQIEAENFSHLDQKTQFFLREWSFALQVLLNSHFTGFCKSIEQSPPPPPSRGVGGEERDTSIGTSDMFITTSKLFEWYEIINQLLQR